MLCFFFSKYTVIKTHYGFHVFFSDIFVSSRRVYLVGKRKQIFFLRPCNHFMEVFQKIVFIRLFFHFLSLIRLLSKKEVIRPQQIYFH